MATAGSLAGIATLATTGMPALAAGLQTGKAEQIKKAGEPYPVNPTIRSPKTHNHPADFTVMTVGTGCPDTIVGRSGPSSMVQYKGNYFLTDVGAGTTFRLVESGINIGKIKNILITHMHNDHTDGYMKFMIESWTMGRRNTDIVGTEGVKAMHNVFRTAFEGDINYRLGKTGTTDGIYTAVDIKEIEGKNTFTLDDVKIKTAPTIHAVYNLAYRFEADGKSIVISGDTSYSTSLIELAKDADVLVLDIGRTIGDEYLGPGEMKGPPKKPKTDNNGKGLIDSSKMAAKDYEPVEVPGRTHGTLEDMSILAARANVKKLVLTHYPPFAVEVAATEARIREFFDGEIIFGQDMLEITP